MRAILPRIKAYEEMGIGLFIHYGLYSQLGQGEWTEYVHHRQKNEYERLIATFTAENFDAQQIVATAKSLGAKYIVLTAKHHEGFFLYDTHGLSTFDVVHSPAKRDLIKEFVDACHEAEIQPFLYMATYDWHNPDYEHNFPAYLDYLRKSVALLCQNYGNIGGFWFDGNWDKPDANWQMEQLYHIIRQYQPEAIIVNNTGLKRRGQISNTEVDVTTYERGIPSQVNHGDETGKYYAGEMSMTLNQHWGFAKNDFNYLAPGKIIESIAHAREVGANILINIGPKGSGKISAIQTAYLELIGRWVKLAGNALHYGRPTVYRTLSDPQDFILEDAENYYFFIHHLKIQGPDNVVLEDSDIDQRQFDLTATKFNNLHWLDNQEILKFTAKSTLTISATPFPYGTDTVVRIAQASKIK